MKTLPEGTKIVCPECKLHICTSKVTIVTDDKLYSRLFLPADGVKISDHTPMECPKCQVAYGENGKLHTEDGWQ